MQVLHNIDYIGAFSNRYNVKLLLPKSVLENKGRNNYYFLPFILGLLGLFFHISKIKNGIYLLIVKSKLSKQFLSI